MAAVGERIKALRKAKGLSQIDLAQKAEIAVNSIRLYEAGKREPKLEAIEKLSAALGVTQNYLLGSEQEQNGEWEGLKTANGTFLRTFRDVCAYTKENHCGVVAPFHGAFYFIAHVNPENVNAASFEYDRKGDSVSPAVTSPEPAKHTLPDKLPIEKLEGGEKRPMYQAIIHLLGIKGVTLARMCFDLKLCRADIQALNGYQKGVISEPHLEKIAAYLDTTVADIKKEADRQKAARQCGFTSPYQEDVDPRNNTLQITKWYEPNRRFVELTEETYQELQALVESTGRSIDYLVEALMEFALARVTVVELRSVD